MKHGHHHRHEDDAAIFVRKTKSAKKRRKALEKGLFAFLCVLAVVIVAYAVYIYI